MAAELGLDQALRASQQDLRYPLSVAQPLELLASEFAHSPHHIRKVGELRERGHSYFRRVRGDGNCFYRAICFAWLESLVDRAARGEGVDMPLPGGWPESAKAFGALSQEYTDLRLAVGRLASSPVVGQELLARILGDVRFDLCAVSLIRLVVADYLQHQGGASDGTSLSAELGVQIAEHGSLTNFIRSQILALGQEAEGASVAVAAMQLGVRLDIVQLDGSPGPVVQYVYPCENFEGPLGIKICLLFRPGHYDVLYHKQSPRYSDPQMLKAGCSNCRQITLLVTKDRLPCAHRLCTACGNQSAKIGECPCCTQATRREMGLASAPRESNVWCALCRNLATQPQPVQCCDAHLCGSCLNTFLARARQQPGSQVQCPGCGTPWQMPAVRTSPVDRPSVNCAEGNWNSAGMGKQRASTLPAPRPEPERREERAGDCDCVVL